MTMDVGDSPSFRVQLKGDRSNKEPTWWEVCPKAQGNDASEAVKAIFKALDDKKIVLAGIQAEGTKLAVKQIRIQFNDSGSR